MDCKQAQDLMSAHVDGELDAATALQMERHIAGCAACGAALAQQLELRGAIAQHGTGASEAPHSHGAGSRAAAPARDEAVALGVDQSGHRRRQHGRFRGDAGAVSGPAIERRTAGTGSGGEPFPLADAGPSGRRGVDRSAHGQALVRRQARFFAAGGRSGDAGFSAGRRTARLSEPARGGGAGLQAPQAHHQSVSVARTGGARFGAAGLIALGLPAAALARQGYGVFGRVGYEWTGADAVFASAAGEAGRQPTAISIQYQRAGLTNRREKLATLASADTTTASTSA